MSLHVGTCSRVLESKDRNYAYKFNKKRKVIGSSFLNEIQIMKYMEHEKNKYTTILDDVGFSSSCLVMEEEDEINQEEYDNLAIKMQKYDSNLFEFINNDPCGLLSYDVKFDLCLNICFCVYYIHTLDIVHTDLKPGNVIIDSVLPILCDFDTAFFNRTHTRLRKTKTPRTTQYGAPELFVEKEYSFPIDIWALGLIICFIFGKTFNVTSFKEALEISYFPEEDLNCVKNFYNSDFERRDDDDDWKIISDEEGGEEENSLLVNLIQRCLHPVPSKRITIDEILNHPYIKREKTKLLILKNKKNIIQIASEKLEKYSKFSPTRNFITFGLRKPVIDYIKEISSVVSPENKFEVVSHTIRLFDLYVSTKIKDGGGGGGNQESSFKNLVFFIFNMVLKTLSKNEIPHEFFSKFKIMGEDKFCKKELEIFRDLGFVLTPPYIADVKKINSTEECITSFLESNTIMIYENLDDLEFKLNKLKLKC